VITADVVAAAIVAACKETEENPIACACGEERVRARHYAMHALIRVFPEAKRQAIARMVGAPGKLKYFYKNSLVQTANRTAKIFKAKWWSSQSFHKVVDATFSAAEIAPKEVRSAASLSSPPTDQSALTAKPPPSFAVPGKRNLYDMLAESVRNTAAMQKKGET
jgi:hypothetical protein